MEEQQGTVQIGVGGRFPYHTIPMGRRAIFSPLDRSVAFPYFFIVLRRVPSHSILMSGVAIFSH